MAKIERVMKTKEASENEDSNNVYDVDKILNKRESSIGVEYHVKWLGYPDSSNTWEPAENILQEKLIKDYERRQAAGPPAKRSQKTKKMVRVVEREEKDYIDSDQSTDEEVIVLDAEEDVVADKPGPVKSEWARTATTEAPAKKAPTPMPMPKPKAQLNGKNDLHLEPKQASKSVVKVEMIPQARRAPATEPRANLPVEPVTNKTTTAQAKPKATPNEPIKMPIRRTIPSERITKSAAKETGMKNAQAGNEQEEDMLDSLARDEPTLPTVKKRKSQVYRFANKDTYGDGDDEYPRRAGCTFYGALYGEKRLRSILQIVASKADQRGLRFRCTFPGVPGFRWIEFYEIKKFENGPEKFIEFCNDETFSLHKRVLFIDDRRKGNKFFQKMVLLSEARKKNNLRVAQACKKE